MERSTSRHRKADLHLHSNFSYDVLNLPQLSPRALYDKAVRKGMGFVPQGRMIFPYLTVEEQLCEVAELHLGVGREQARANMRFGLQQWVRYFNRVGALPVATTGQGSLDEDIESHS